MYQSMNKVGSVLVIGAGIAGIQASLDLAESGFKVYLVEKTSSIGGRMAQLDKTFPTGDCAMCTIAPKMVEIGRNPDIVKLTLSEVVSVKGEAGNFEVTVRRHPRYVLDSCNGCGLCAEVCPIKVPNEFDQGVGTRKAIFIPFPQAMPLTYTIDREHCTQCGLCKIVCGLNAIEYEDAPKEIKLNVGAIVVSTGYELFNPAALEEYGYRRYRNVLTNQEFERLLSASGPTAGHIIRPSGGEAKSVAFIQCVGSRDVRYYPYCSRICCMASTKEAIVAKEHNPELQSYVLYMDLRSFGKGFQEYVNKAREDYGVEYIRGRVSEIAELTNKNLVLSYESTEAGKLEKLEVELVVLAAALKPSSGSKNLAEILGIATDEHGYFREAAEEAPFETIRAGIYINGTCQGPKDIPDSVAQASGAASKVMQFLSEARNTQIRMKEKTPEKEIPHEPRVGVFVCHCGLNIASVVDVKAVAEQAKTLSNVVFATNTMYACSDDTQGEIKKAIQEHNLTRVVIASCTPRTHEPLFRSTCEEAGLNPYLFEMTNIREHCSWVHSKEKEKATEKSKDLVRMAVAKARLLQPQQKGRAGVEGAALVIGGGVAGMTAALDIARQGFKVELIEKSQKLGGALNKAHSVFLEGRNPDEILEPLRKAVEENTNIRIHLNSALTELKGFAGNFEASVKQGSETEKLKVGGIVVATGSQEFKPRGMYRYGENENVVTLAELEKELRSSFEYESVAILLCVEARNEERPYCSRTCCAEAVKNAIILKKNKPASIVYILYRDLMMFGKYEEYYKKSQELGIKYIRYAPEALPEVKELDGRLKVRVYDTLFRREIELEADKLVLATPQVAPEGIEELQKTLKVPRSPDGFFMEAHAKLRPLEFTSDGIYLCGAAQAPKELSHAIAQASGAAARVCALISKEYIEADAAIAVVNPELCIGCGRCVETCVFEAISFEKNEKGEYKASVNSATCKGCGACAPVCPNAAIAARQFTKEQILAMIEELTEAGA